MSTLFSYSVLFCPERSRVHVMVLLPEMRRTNPALPDVGKLQLRLLRPSASTRTETWSSLWRISRASLGQTASPVSDLKTLPLPECMTSKLKEILSLPMTDSLNPDIWMGELELATDFPVLGSQMAFDCLFSRSFSTQMRALAVVPYL